MYNWNIYSATMLTLFETMAIESIVYECIEADDI